MYTFSLVIHWCRVHAVVITFCLVLVEMKPVESHDVMSNIDAVTDLCARESTRMVEENSFVHGEVPGQHEHGRRLHGHDEGLGLSCDVQWCTFNESAIIEGTVLSPLCVPDCEVTGRCPHTPTCSIHSIFDETTNAMVKITDEQTCLNNGGGWGHSFLRNYLLEYNWPKAQTHLAASVVLMSMWFVSAERAQF